MKSVYISPDLLNGVVSRMKYENGLAIRVCFATGLRLSDVLGIKYSQISASNKITVRESKTDKSRRVYIPVELHREMVQNAKHFWAFPHRTKTDRPRTRQAVYMDFKQACERSGIDPAGLSPHSVRKAWAVKKRAGGLSIPEIQKLMNHAKASVTALYALSDML